LGRAGGEKVEFTEQLFGMIFDTEEGERKEALADVFLSYSGPGLRAVAQFHTGVRQMGFIFATRSEARIPRYLTYYSGARFLSHWPD